jgi:hypothetical protein
MKKKRIFLYVAIALSIALLFSCRARVIPRDTKVTKEFREEIKTKINPFKLQATEELTFDSAGELKPITLNLRYEDLFEGMVSIKKGIVEFTMENKDTLDLGTVVTENKEAESETFIPVKQKLPKWFWWSIGFNAFIILLFVLRVVLRVIKPI